MKKFSVNCLPNQKSNVKVNSIKYSRIVTDYAGKT